MNRVIRNPGAQTEREWRLLRVRLLVWCYLGAIGFFAGTVADQAQGQCVVTPTVLFNANVSGGAANNRFGNAVAVDKDTIVGGAGLGDHVTPSRIDAGFIIVWKRAGGFGGFGSQGTLFASDAAAGQMLGIDVDLEGNTIVGAAPGAGALYTFTRTGSTWSQQQKILPADAPGTATGFANVVAMSGNTIVSGAATDDTAASNGGAVYVFAFNGSTWAQQAKLTASDAVASTLLGQSVDIDGDTLIAGATNAAYIFVRGGGIWSQQAKLTVGGSADFGRAVAIDGNRVIVGDPVVNTSTGAVSFFTRSGTTWSHEQTVAIASGTNSNTGNAVALQGSFALVGSYRNDNFGTNAGRAFGLLRNGGTWTHTQNYDPSPAEASGEYGTDVAVRDALMMIGMPNEAATNDGAAYVYGPSCHGACCVNGQCAYLSLQDCETLGGAYQGPDIQCPGILCDPGCCRGDFNSDQLLDGLDVEGFTNALLAGEVCP